MPLPSMMPPPPPSHFKKFNAEIKEKPVPSSYAYTKNIILYEYNLQKIFPSLF